MLGICSFLNLYWSVFKKDIFLYTKLIKIKSRNPLFVRKVQIHSAKFAASENYVEQGSPIVFIDRLSNECPVFI